jgi:hypothetical protein
MIVKSAIIYNGKIFTGSRHPGIMKEIRDVFGSDIKIKSNMQGFITDDNKFLSRDSARDHARECNQISEKFNKVLTSEDLW